jgi:hypothetical protein
MQRVHDYPALLTKRFIVSMRFKVRGIDCTMNSFLRDFESIRRIFLAFKSSKDCPVFILLVKNSVLPHNLLSFDSTSILDQLICS